MKSATAAVVFKKDFKGSPDGVRTLLFKEGDRHHLPAELAGIWEDAGVLELAGRKAPAPKAKSAPKPKAKAAPKAKAKAKAETGEE